MEPRVMLIPNNPDLDFQELNRRIEAEVERYKHKAADRPLPAFNPLPSNNHDRPYSWLQLVQLEDEALVRAAFPTLLGRKAESEELQRYLNRLRSGWDKFEILAELRDSPEGVRQNTPVEGLRRARMKNRIRRIPILGKLAMTLYGLLQSEQRNRYYVARLDLLARQNRLQVSELHTLRDLSNAHASLLDDHQTYAEQQSLALHRQADELRRLESELKEARNVQQELRMRLQQLERQPRTVMAAPGEAQAVVAVPEMQHQSGIPDSFYLAFENRFRGAAETIRERQAYYLPIIDSVAPLKAGLPLVDIGCGRGEWLQQLPEHCARIGIDLNSMNVQTCLDQGLTAHQQDALVWLANQPENSLGAVSAFHVIEHLSFEQFNTLLDECLRVLAPGGMIIFETPNPENIATAAHYFWMDPTHLSPLPPAFTEFLVQFKGFDQVQIHRLQPIPEEHHVQEDSEAARRINALFYGAQDYAVVATKSLT
ncbi:hypothetical protein AL532_00205 (plasmid) [Pseudomonas monteilii]|nr:hypothetical protein AL532_00205 [Pseudomonas monteilii]